ncbi:hypothetical protein E2C01_077174 [Portunus trituberculatus]|uniref:Uncharacterized protein n=1 Tax=Portunus trituberculatus TaxID=210409 RepID=A0A5B7IJM6_PORTR|nr:hypothetical protein [Portunus trituberculatus]
MSKATETTLNAHSSPIMIVHTVTWQRQIRILQTLLNDIVASAAMTPHRRQKTSDDTQVSVGGLRLCGAPCQAVTVQLQRRGQRGAQGQQEPHASLQGNEFCTSAPHLAVATHIVVMQGNMTPATPPSPPHQHND